MVMLVADRLDEETLLKKLPFVTVDEIETILQNRMREEGRRFMDEGVEEDAQTGNWPVDRGEA